MITHPLFRRFLSLKVVAMFLLFIAIVVSYLPFNPRFPSDGLDPSWEIAINYAVEHHLHFGSELIFTFGPYGYLYTRLFSPFLDSSTFFFLSFFVLQLFCAICCINNLTYKKIVFIALIFLFIRHTMDTLFFISMYVSSLSSVYILESRRRISILFLLPLLYITFGMLPLVKGTFTPLAIFVPFAFFVYCIFKRRIIVGCVPIVAFITGYVIYGYISGYTLTDSYLYNLNLLPIVSGYSDAMQIDGSIHEIILFIFADFFALYVLKLSSITISRKIYIGIVFIAFSYIVYKAGFTRHDGHAEIALDSLFLMIVFTFLPISDSICRRLVFALIMVSYAFLLITSLHYTLAPILYDELIVKRNISYPSDKDSKYRLYLKSMFNGGFNNIFSRIFVDYRANNVVYNAITGLITRYNKSVDYNYNVRKDEILAGYNLPELVGSSDVYTNNQAPLILDPVNSWNPRPIFQSYSSYHPLLTNINYRHLASNAAPQNVLLDISSIDSRLPFMDDGPSWPILLYNYVVSGVDQNFIYLKKCNTCNFHLVHIYNSEFTFNSLVDLSKLEFPIYAKIEVSNNFTGILLALIYKKPIIYMQVNYSDGTSSKFRLVQSNAKSGFILSPIVLNNDDFLSLKEGSGRRPSSIKVQYDSIFEAYDSTIKMDLFNIQPTR